MEKIMISSVFTSDEMDKTEHLFSKDFLFLLTSTMYVLNRNNMIRVNFQYLVMLAIL